MSLPSVAEPLEARIAPAVFNVTTLTDSGHGSLREAITLANIVAGADTILIKAGMFGTIELASELPTITDSVAIVAKTRGVVLDGNGKSRVLSIAGTDLDVTLSKLAFLGGKAASGGAIEIDDAGGTVKIQKCSFTGNKAQAGDDPAALARGGAIANLAGELTIEKCSFSGNTASAGQARGGAIFNLGALNLSSAMLAANKAAGAVAEGGAIYNAGTAILVASTLSGNLAVGNDGKDGPNGTNGARGDNAYPGAYGYEGYDGTNGTSGTDGGTARGGALFNAGTLALRSSTISGNTARGGAGGNGGDGGDGGRGGNGGPSYTYDDYFYAEGYAGNGGFGGNGGNAGAGGSALGGGIFSGALSTFTLQDSTITGNDSVAGGAGANGAAGLGGAIGDGRIPTPGGDYAGFYAVPGGVGAAGLAAADGRGAGGGVFSSAASITISQSTLAANEASDAGGGAAFEQNAFTQIHNSTIALNKSEGAAGGIAVLLDLAQHPVSLVSTLIARNTAPAQPDLAGFIHAEASLIETTAVAQIEGADNLLGIMAYVTKLKPSGVVGLKPFSPAVNNGLNPDGLNLDQLKNPRILGPGIDIGAVEKI